MSRKFTNYEASFKQDVFKNFKILFAGKIILLNFEIPEKDLTAEGFDFEKDVSSQLQEIAEIAEKMSFNILNEYVYSVY